MTFNKFLQRKNAILSKKDKSSMGGWDKKIKSLCDKINKSKNYYTTSSCSGRIIVMIDQEKKGEGLFEFVSHDLVTEKDFFDFLNSFNLSPPTQDPKNSLASLDNNSSKSSSPDFADKKVVKMKIISKIFQHNPEKAVQLNSVVGESNFARQTLEKNNERGCEQSNFKNKNLKFKQEPPILHVACRNLEDAEKLLTKMRDAGWKRAGIISLGKNIIIEMVGTQKIEFPLSRNGKILVNDDFLKIVLEKSNKNLKKSWDELEKLEEKI